MTKSYNYIPTHFLYSSLLFFLLIFMHQLTYCHTLPKPFSQIFLFRIYAPTIHSADFELDETSHRFTHISAPIQPPQTNPPTTTDTTPIQPHKHTTTPSHRYTRPYCPPDTHTTQPRPPTLTLTPTHSTLTRRQATPYPDVDAASAPFRTSAIGQARHQQATP